MMAEQDILSLAKQEFADLNEQEARSLTDEIKGAADSLWRLLSEAHNRKAWKALGYTTWDAYVSAEFNMSRRRSYQILDQAQVIRAIGEAAEVCTTVHIPGPDPNSIRTPVIEISEREARDIKPHLEVVTQRIREEVANTPPEKVKEMVQEIINDERQKIERISEIKRENKALAEELGMKPNPENDARVQEMYGLYTAIEAISKMPSPEDCKGKVKPYEQHYVDLVPFVVAWLKKFAEVAA